MTSSIIIVTCLVKSLDRRLVECGVNPKSAHARRIVAKLRQRWILLVIHKDGWKDAWLLKR